MNKQIARLIEKSASVTLLVLVVAFLYSCASLTPKKDLRPTVVLISLDGFRSDYFDKYEPPNLRSLAQDGVRAKWMIPSFPSKTFPNHYAIVTGLYPQNNGIVENNVFDRSFNATFTMSNREEVQNSRWWLGEPIWVTAEKQGQKTAPYFWPGSEAEIAGVRPAYWKPYDGKVPNNVRVDTVLGWLDLPAADRPTFLTLYFNDVDDAGHDFGPDSQATRNAVLNVDAEIGRLVEGLKKRGLWTDVNLIIVSDHGMATEDPKNTIVMDELFDPGLAEKVLWTAEIVSIFPNPGKENLIYNSLTEKLPAHAKVYRKAEMPARFHYSNSPRIAPLLVLPDEGWTLTTRSKLDQQKAEGKAEGLRGGHGYDNELPSMRATFIAHGPAFKRGVAIEPFENVQVYELMTRILGLKPAPNDGKGNLISAALADNYQHP
jgi:predicted AlkP superfamily pyrophosphatase or phosphodiesterase